VFEFLPPQTTHAKRVGDLAEGQFDEMELRSDEFRWDVNGESFPHVKKVCRDRVGYDYICWNVRRCTALADKTVRRALAHAVDLDMIRDLDFGGLFPSFRGIWGNRAWGAPPGGKIEPLAYDPTRSRELLDQAGWRLDAVRGVRRKGDQ